MIKYLGKTFDDCCEFLIEDLDDHFAAEQLEERYS